MPKPPQRSPEHFIMREKVSSSDMYTVVASHPTKKGHFAKVGEALVDYHKGGGRTSYQHHESGWTTNPEKGKIPEAQGFGQGELFHHSGNRAMAEVWSMTMAHSARSEVPAMLGVMQNRAREKGYPEGLTAPTDLSQHSSKLISGLQGRGVVPKESPTEVTNEYDWRPEPTEDHYGEVDFGAYEVVSPQERAAGYQTTKDTLRAARGPKPHLSEQLSAFNVADVPRYKTRLEETRSSLLRR